MESIRAQRMKKIMNIKGEVGGRYKDFNIKIPSNAHEILRKSASVNIIQQCRTDLQKKILNDEFNNIKSYDILNADSEKKSVFKSMNNMYDLQTLKITKLYKKKKPTSDLEKEIRQELKAGDKKLLLSEIYEYLEESDEVNVQRKKKTQLQEDNLNLQEEYKEHDELNELAIWTKRLKKAKKNNNNQSQSALRMPPKPLNRASTDILRMASLKGDKSPSSNTPRNTDVKQKLLNAVNKITNLSGDLALQKKLENYMTKGQDVGKEDFKQLADLKDEEGAQNNFDYSVDGVQRTYNTLVKVQVSTFRSEAEKAIFYKKQSIVILNKLINKMNANRQSLILQETTEQKLRIENHDILDKLNQIAELTNQLNEEMEQVTDSNKRGDSLQKKKRESVVNMLMNQSQRQQELERDLKILAENKIAYKQKLAFNKHTLEQLSDEITAKKKENKHINNSLISFYYYLLKSAQDVRTTGIAWIIVELIHLNEKVLPKYLPDYLDGKSKEYLLQKAVLMEEIDFLEKDLGDSFKQYKQETQENSIQSMVSIDQTKLSAIDVQNAKLSESKRSPNTYNLENLAVMTIGLNHEQVDALDTMITQLNQQNLPMTENQVIYKEMQKKIHQAIKTSRDLDQSTIIKEQAIHHYDESNQKLNRIRMKLQQLDDEQLHRIVKEFDYKNYSKRIYIDPVTVLSTLFGGVRCDREVIKNGMKKMNYNS